MQLEQVPIQFVPGEVSTLAPLAPPPPPPAPMGLAAITPAAWIGIGALVLLLWAMNPRR